MKEASINEHANILIVDDVPANLVILSEMIKELGYGIALCGRRSVNMRRD